MSKLAHTRSGKVESATAPSQWAPVTDRFTWNAPNLIYRDDGGSHKICLGDLFLPATPAHPRTLTLDADSGHLATLLAVVDQLATRSRNNCPSLQLVMHHVHFFRHFLDWCRSQAIYRLSDFDHHAASKLLDQYSSGGWNGALRVEERWNAAIDNASGSSFDPNEAFRFTNHFGDARLESLRSAYWRQLLGWGGRLPVTGPVRQRLEALASAPPSRNWLARCDAEVTPPTEFSLRNALSHINDYCKLPSSVDRPLHRISQSVNRDARRLAGKSSERTPNLSVEDATRLFSAALRVLYQIAPLLNELLSVAKQDLGNEPQEKESQTEWLVRQPILTRLEELTGRPVRRWVGSGQYANDDQTWTVDQIIGVVQGACAIVIAAMNARRSREVCDPVRGIRLGDLIAADDELSVYRANFYIEKTYCDRHQFYVNRTTADAFRCLESMKTLLQRPTRSAEASRSLFACGRRGIRRGIRQDYHFSFFLEDAKVRSLGTFLAFAYGDDKPPEVASHMFRRFFAILYYHQYDHPDLRALKQHLRHIDVAMTRTYVTDNAARPLGERIRRKLGGDRLSVVAGSARASLDGGFDDLQSVVKTVGREKFRSTIDGILSGNGSFGGFSRIVRAMYRKLAVSAAFTDASAAQTITTRLEQGGYALRAMEHGQCHAPEQRRSLRGKCEHAGVLAREHASALLCNTCPFHYSDERYLRNIKDEMASLEVDVEAGSLPGMMREKARSDLHNLRILIAKLESHTLDPAERIDRT